jgi:AcrR family transcriptional regulator
MKKPMKPKDLRRQSQREIIARLLLLGWTAERVAQRLHVTPRAIRYHLATPEFEALYTKLQQEYLQRIDRKLGSLLHGAVDGLEKMLRHSDWRARDAAIEKILRIHGRYIERVDVSGTLDHTGQVRHVHAELVEGSMSDEMRQKARELLAMQRGMLQRQLPARLTSPDPNERDHHPTNGRFLRSTNDDVRE